MMEKNEKRIYNNYFIIIGILAFLPFFILTGYTHPLGLHDWDWNARYFLVFDTSQGFFEQQKWLYTSVMGRYSSTAFCSLMPYWFSIINFKIFLGGFILLFFSSFYYWVRNLFEGFLPKKEIFVICISLISLYLAQLTSPYEAFYNFSCISTYNLGAFAYFIFLGLLIKRFRDRVKFGGFSSMSLFLLGVFIVGVNEISLVILNLLLVFLIAGIKFYNKKWDRFILALFVVVLMFSLVAVLAPGNFTRMDVSDTSRNVARTVFLTISTTFFNWIRWLSTTPFIILTLLYIPLGVKLAKKEEVQLFFNYPLFSGVLTFLMQPTCLVLLFWSVGNDAFPERVMDLIFLLTLPIYLFFLQSLVVLGLEKKWLKPNFNYPTIITISLSLLFAFQLFFNGLNIDKSKPSSEMRSYLSVIKTDSNIGNAWLELFNGNASVYDFEMNRVYKAIENCEDERCVVPGLSGEPQFIYDKIFDRKAINGGQYIVVYFNTKAKTVIYDNAEGKK